MASGKTENYGLSQWEATDQVVRGDFNADNEKLDAAIKTAQNVADSAQKKANAAWGPENPPFVVGCYAGDGTATRVVDLGFTPQAVLLLGSGLLTYSSGYTYGGLAVTGHAVGKGCPSEWTSDKTSLMIVEGGFQVGKGASNTSTNSAELSYNYIAFR